MTKQPLFANNLHTFDQGSKSEPLHKHPFGDAFVPKYSLHKPLQNPSADMAEPSAQHTDVLSASGYVHTRRVSIIHIMVRPH